MNNLAGGVKASNPSVSLRFTFHLSAHPHLAFPSSISDTAHQQEERYHE